jgi:hypothetical protein
VLFASSASFFLKHFSVFRVYYGRMTVRLTPELRKVRLNPAFKRFQALPEPVPVHVLTGAAAPRFVHKQEASISVIASKPLKAETTTMELGV